MQVTYVWITTAKQRFLVTVFFATVLSLELFMLKFAVFPLKVPFISTLQSCPFLEVLTAQGYPISLLLER